MSTAETITSSADNTQKKNSEPLTADEIDRIVEYISVLIEIDKEQDKEKIDESTLRNI